MSVFEVVGHQAGRVGLLDCGIGRKTPGGYGLELQDGHVENGRCLC
jgi:hypothetical protein